MADGKLLVVIIRTPKSDRYLPIESLIKDDQRFNLEYIEASMTPSYSEVSDRSIAYSSEVFEYFQGRKLTPEEIGCADSHNRARKIIKDNHFGGIILEDDARILDIDLLFQEVNMFLNVKKNTASVLSLTGFRNLSKKKGSQISFTRILTQPDLAVGYALNSSASHNLLNANCPITNVADWPQSKCNYYVSSLRKVIHGDLDTKSLIDTNELGFRSRPRKNLKFRNFFFILFLKKSPGEITFKNYFLNVIIPSILWRTEKIRLILFGFRVTK
jgi:hypothetical protein